MTVAIVAITTLLHPGDEFRSYRKEVFEITVCSTDMLWTHCLNFHVCESYLFSKPFCRKHNGVNCSNYISTFKTNENKIDLCRISNKIIH